MDTSEFIRLYPKLYHMAAADSWPLIREHGLLSTQALLQLFEIPGAHQELLIGHRRPKSVTIRHPQWGTAVVRDQKPLDTTKLARCLTDMMVGEWLHLLNSRVFFWVQPQRLERLLAARAYRTTEHLVITVDTERLLDHVGLGRVSLSRINSGSTLFSPPQRGTQTFKSVAEFQHPPRRRALASATDVAELCVNWSVPDIAEVADRAELRGQSSCQLVWVSDRETR